MKIIILLDRGLEEQSREIAAHPLDPVTAFRRHRTTFSRSDVGCIDPSPSRLRCDASFFEILRRRA